MPPEVPSPNQSSSIHQTDLCGVKNYDTTLRYNWLWSLSPESSINVLSPSPLPLAWSLNSWRSACIHGFRRWIWFFRSRTVDFGSTLKENQPLSFGTHGNRRMETAFTVRVAIVFEPEMLTMTTWQKIMKSWKFHRSNVSENESTIRYIVFYIYLHSFWSSSCNDATASFVDVSSNV